MTSIAALPPASYGPQNERAVRAGRLQASGVHADHVYDPVLDPAVNPALRGQAVEEITVTAKAEKAKPDNNNELSFWDLLDLVNPLQHIPVVNTLYRHMTGDTIKTPVQLIGATVLGGPIGFATAMVDSIIEESTGTDIGGHAMAMVNKEKPQPTHAPIVMPGETQIADAREFIPQDPYEAPVPQAAPRTAVERIPVERMPVERAQMAAAPQAAPAAQVSRAPQQVAQAAQAQKREPTESEAIVQTAQIAAQANVFPTFKRSGTPTAAQGQQTAAPNQTLQAGARYMPINRANAMTMAPARRDGDTRAEAELKARSKFAPGPISHGGAQLAPATLATAQASQNKTAAPVSAQEAYNYGRNVSSGAAPAEMPAWFDGAMKNAIDKYQAMQNAK